MGRSFWSGKFRRSCNAAALLLGAALGVMGAAGAEAQRLDVREDPSICSTALSSSCLDSLGAGAIEAPGEAKPGSAVCARQLAVYSACIGYASGGGSGKSSGAKAGGGLLPLSVSGVLTPKKRDVFNFSHRGGRVRVVASETATAAVVSLRTDKGVELVKRTSKIGGGEREFSQCLPEGDYQLSIYARSKGTAYKVVVNAIGEC